MSGIATGSKPPTSVLIVEDNRMFRDVLARCVRTMPLFQVVGEAGTVAEGLALAKEHQPNIVMLDWMLGRESGLEFLRRLGVEPRPRVLVFSVNASEHAIREALDAGACGFIAKTASFPELMTALDAIAAGRSYLGPEALQALAIERESPAGRSGLSQREREVLRLLASGLSSKQIAAELGLSARTVENHRANMMRRTGLHSVALLTQHAARLGLIEVEPSRGPDNA